MMALNRFFVKFGSILVSPLSAASFRPLHTSSVYNFHFMRSKVIDTELAKKREERKRRKLAHAIKMLKKFSKKPKPVEELRIDPRLVDTLEERKRGPAEEVDEEEMYRRIMVGKNYSRSRARLARSDINWIRRSTDAQRKALELLQQISPRLYDAAVQPDENLLPQQFQGPPLTPAISGYKSPDGEYKDVTKQWIQPIMPALEKKFSVGRLIKAPTFQKTAAAQQKGKEPIKPPATAVMATPPKATPKAETRV